MNEDMQDKLIVSLASLSISRQSQPHLARNGTAMLDPSTSLNLITATASGPATLVGFDNGMNGALEALPLQGQRQRQRRVEFAVARAVAEVQVSAILGWVGQYHSLIDVQQLIESAVPPLRTAAEVMFSALNIPCYFISHFFVMFSV
jgi:hypothetical protein